MESGSLSQGTLQGLVQDWNQRRLNAAVRVESSVGIGHIWFEAGQIVDAQLGELRADAALSRLITVTDGNYRVEPAGTPARSYPAPTMVTSSVSSWPAVQGLESKPPLPKSASPEAKSAYAALHGLKPMGSPLVGPDGPAPPRASAPERSTSGQTADPGKPGFADPVAPDTGESSRVVPNMIVSVSNDRKSIPPLALDSLLPHAEAAAGPGRKSVPPPGNDPHDLKPGAVVARYEVLSLLGRGSMGTVYLVRLRGQGGFERLFALKVLLPQLAANSNAEAALVNEARVMSRVNHTNVVAVLDVGIHEGRAFVVMNYVRGCSVQRLLANGNPMQSVRTIVPILLDALAGLHALHSAQDENRSALSLVHHDVNPENFLVGLDGVCRLSDLGLAGLTELVTGSGSGEHHGMTEYLSPERAKGEQVDCRSDVFAFGALVWGTLTGQSLFKSSSVEQTLKNVLELTVPAPSSVSNSPPCLDHLCLKALERDPKKRFQDAALMSQELRRVAVSNDLLGSPGEVAAWVKDVVGSGSNFAATGGGALAHELARLDVLNDETPFSPSTPGTLLHQQDRPSGKIQLLQWMVALLAVALLGWAALSPEFLSLVTFGLLE